MATDDLVSKREQTLAKISERHVRTRERVLKSLDENCPPMYSICWNNSNPAMTARPA
jgi:hypothetical protein